ncbi:hypothetical protein HMPREF0576_0572 [Mobiluncus holmesii ATCC 35242]|uniref:Uncharacterized protein n=2 Tax=Actinomycetaceae TaxID=2049 RepID=E6M2L7_9ACTO|nr:hypothetical protein HMPREF0576_0572 [Mobiluncus holmesii ATCC 35242]
MKKSSKESEQNVIEDGLQLNMKIILKIYFMLMFTCGSLDKSSHVESLCLLSAQVR